MRHAALIPSPPLSYEERGARNASIWSWFSLSFRGGGEGCPKRNNLSVARVLQTRLEQLIQKVGDGRRVIAAYHQVGCLLNRRTGVGHRN